jgi:hypothetical protein
LLTLSGRFKISLLELLNEFCKKTILPVCNFNIICLIRWIIYFSIGTHLSSKMGWGINFENINFDSCKILASTWLLGPTKY